MLSKITDKDSCILAVIDREGLFSNDPSDPGGATKYGITLRTLSAFKGIPCAIDDIKNLNLDEAKQIYDIYFWEDHKLSQLDVGIAHFLFDSIIQHGKKPIIWIQQILNLKADGIIGPNTINAINKANQLFLISELSIIRNFFYERLAVYSTYMHGWKRRLFEVTIEATVASMMKVN